MLKMIFSVQIYNSAKTLNDTLLPCAREITACETNEREGARGD